VRLRLTNHAEGGVPYDGAAVYLWQADRNGDYSMYGQTLASETYLRGVQVAYADGLVEFTSIFPGAPVGRWPHLNVRIYQDLQHASDGGDPLRTTQIALPRAACEDVYASPGYEQSKDRLSQVSLDSDPVFSDGYSLQLADATGSVSDGYTVELAVPV
jgi:protocatechuate 3,4-dioxygenase beta subunit